MRRRLSLVIAVTAITLAGCASKARVVPVAAAPAAPAPSGFGGHGNLVVPARLADGSYITPNRSVSAAGAVWHLRAGLNVAALSCRGAQEATLVAGYNALLKRYRADFDRAYRTLGTEYGSAAAFDAAMTKLYNYYALPPAQRGLCDAAQGVLSDAGSVSADGLPAFAQTALARIDRPYAKVFSEQEDWLAGRSRAPTAVVAAASAPTVAAPRQIAKPVTAKPVAAKVAMAAAPRIAVDPAVFRMP